MAFGKSWFYGSGISGSNLSRLTLNSDMGYLNQSKGFGWNIDPTNMSANGYPITKPTSGTYSCNPNMTTNYFDDWVLKWDGTGFLYWNSTQAMIVTASTINGVIGSTIFEMGGVSTGDKGPSNTTFCTQSLSVGLTKPRIQFYLGWLIQSISNNGSGLIRVAVKTGFFNKSTGNTVKIQGANANTGANGMWVVTKIDNQTFDLQGSTFTNAQASPGGMGTYAPGTNQSFNMTQGGFGSFSGMDNLVFCKSGDEAAITAGQIMDGTLISLMQTFAGKPGGVGRSGPFWLRFMNQAGVQSSFECDFSQRIPASYIGYSAINYRPGYWTGTITNTSDALTCSDPSVSVWSGTAYIDNAIVQGAISASNTTGTPTLAVGGHPAKPIFLFETDSATPISFRFSGPPTTPGTDVLQYTFQASWLNGGTPYVFSYHTVAGDTSISALCANLDAAIGLDTTLSSNFIFHGNIAGVGVGIYPRTAQAGRLTVTYSSGPAICTVVTTRVGTISGTGTFVYNYLLDGWVFRSGGMTCSAPFEAIVEYCNRVGANCWFNIGTTKGQWVTDITNFFGDATTGLTSGLQLGFEAWNETWNLSAHPAAFLQTLGKTLGVSDVSFRSNYGMTGLRTKQYMDLAKTAWSGKGRASTDLFTLLMAQQLTHSVNDDWDQFQLKLLQFSSSNTIFTSFGGLNGGSYPGFGSTGRPVDLRPAACGFAPYWNSKWMGNGSFTTASQIVGPTSENAVWLQNALDYANGLTSAVFASLSGQFQGTVVRSSGSTGGTNLASLQSQQSAFETVLAQYDPNDPLKIGFFHYEGAPSFGIGADGNNGVNSVNNQAASIPSGDIGALASRMTALGWNVSTWTSSGTNNTTEMATMVLVMLQGWKFDVDVNGNPSNTGSYDQLNKLFWQSVVTTSAANREVHPCQFTFGGPSNWCMLPLAYDSGIQYMAVNAAIEFNT